MNTCPPKAKVRGSNPLGRATSVRSIPDTWVTVYSGDMGNSFGPKGVGDRFEPTCLVVEVAEIVVHEGGEPKMFVDLFDSDGLAGEDLAEVDFLAVEADAAAGGDGDRLVVEWIMQVRQASIGTR